MEYPRPEPTEKEKVHFARLIHAILRSPRKTQIEIIAQLMLENNSLVKEVNDHRAARGYDPLPVYQPKIK